MSDVLLQVEDLHKNFTVKDAQGRKKILKAVDGVSFSIERGKTLGLVGESGSGKTTTGRTVLRLTEPDGGRILYAGEDITHKNRKPLRRKMQIIFQNPTGSLDRKMRVLDIVAEGLTANRMTGSRAETETRVMELLRSVGLQESDAYRYPGEFSGGQQQRIGIARALAVEPEFIVCDEPVSALDVSYQAQIVNMLEDLQKELGLTYLFISHDLSVVMHISDSIGVMYLGRLVETGPCEEVILHAAHPYTKALLAAIPVADPKIAKSRVRQTAVPERPRSSGGCAFCPRCPDAKSVCFEQTPDSREIAPGHFCACHLYG